MEIKRKVGRCWLLLMIFIILGCKEKIVVLSASMPTKIISADQLVTSLTAIAKDPSRQSEYESAMSDVSLLVVEQVKKNPIFFQSFLLETLRVAQQSPLSAMQLEEFANEVVKKEISLWSKESGVAQLREKESQIASLRQEVNGLKKKNRELGSALGDKNELSDLVKKMQAERDSIRMEIKKEEAKQSASAIDGLKNEIKRKEQEIEEAKRQISLVGDQKDKAVQEANRLNSTISEIKEEVRKKDQLAQTLAESLKEKKSGLGWFWWTVIILAILMLIGGAGAAGVK